MCNTGTHAIILITYININCTLEEENNPRQTLYGCDEEVLYSLPGTFGSGLISLEEGMKPRALLVTPVQGLLADLKKVDKSWINFHQFISLEGYVHSVAMKSWSHATHTGMYVCIYICVYSNIKQYIH